MKFWELLIIIRSYSCYFPLIKKIGILGFNSGTVWRWLGQGGFSAGLGGRQEGDKRVGQRSDRRWETGQVFPSVHLPHMCLHPCSFPGPCILAHTHGCWAGAPVCVQIWHLQWLLLLPSSPKLEVHSRADSGWSWAAKRITLHSIKLLQTESWCWW